MAKFYYRIPLCPYYDIGAMEGWLEKMAEKGYILDKDGYVFRFFQFQKTQPQTIRYRLEARTGSPLDILPSDVPEAEALSLNEELGWEYVCTYQDFHIYRTSDPNAPELNTDPVVQAMGLTPLRRRTGFFLAFMILQIAAFLLGLFAVPDLLLREQLQNNTEEFTRYILLFFFLFLSIAYLLRNRNGGKFSKTASQAAVLLVFLSSVFVTFRATNTLPPLLDIIHRGWTWYLRMGAFCGSCLLLVTLSYLHILYLQRKLRLGQELDRRRKRGLLQLVPALLPFVFLFSLSFPGTHSRKETMVPIESVTQPLPFVTMAQLAPEREYIPRDHNGSNTLLCWSDILSPVNYEWSETAWLDEESGSRWGGSLSIYYYKTATEAIAKRLLVELIGNHQVDPSLIPDTVDGDDFDYLGIVDGIHPVILIRKGNVVICTYCSVQSWGDHVNLYPVWLEKMASVLP